MPTCGRQTDRSASVLGVATGEQRSSAGGPAGRPKGSPKDGAVEDEHTPAIVVGAVVGQHTSVDAFMAEVDDLVALGFARVKIKIGPDWDVVPLRAVRERYPDLIIQADANGSYTREQAARLSLLDPFRLACIEQPMGSDDLEGHAALAAAITTPICLDESLTSPASVRTATTMGACQVVCVKPGRLGGLTAALEVYRQCVAGGVPLWIGGMFESGYARAVNTALAGLPGFVLPGDLAPASGYLVEDLVPAPLVSRGGSSGVLRVGVYAGPGMGPAPDMDLVTRHTSASWRWTRVGT